MKHTKRIFAMLLSLAMVMTMMIAMSATVFAAAPTSGSVTVNPNYKDQTYTLYKLFDAKMTYSDAGVLQAVTYQLPSGKTEADLTYNGKSWFELNDNGNVVAKSTTTTDWAKDADAIAWAKSFGTANPTTKTAASDNDANVKWEGLDWGYYFVTTTMGSFIGVDTDNPNVTIQDKNDKPSVDKSITGVKDSEGAASGSVFNATEESEKTDPGAGVNEQAIAQIGDTVSYKLVVKIKPGAQNYVITDTMTNLKIVASSFKVGGAAIADNAKVDATGTTITDGASTFTIKLAQSYLDTIKADTELEITYDAKLDASAAVADAANPNTVKLTYGTNPDKNFSEDSAKVWTAEVDVAKKINSTTGDPLKGAGFILKRNSDNKYYKLVDGVVTWVAEADAQVFMTTSTGALETKFKGLANGTYTLIEKVVPDGYNKMEDTTVTIADNDATTANLSQTKTVVNKSGSVLPSTGGIGTVIFYVLGSALLIGCGVVLVSRRRMTKEK